MEKVKTFWWPLKVKNIGQYFPNELDMNPVPSSSFSKRQMLYICMKQDGVDKYIQYLKTHRKEGNTRVKKIVVNSKFFSSVFCSHLLHRRRRHQELIRCVRNAFSSTHTNTKNRPKIIMSFYDSFLSSTDPNFSYIKVLFQHLLFH